ncbi:MAG: hypothetical protein J6C13_04560 [Clostridia bacterium]|nr:hypothetical protein [Clostridia bacterium]
MSDDIITFNDRESANPNRRKLVVVSQTPTEILVDVERVDTPTKEGDKIDAATLNKITNKLKSLSTQVVNSQGTNVKFGDVSQNEVVFISDPQTQITNEVTARTTADNSIINNTTKIANTNGGFAAGSGAESITNGIQLGSGTNSTANSLQVFGDNIYNASSHTLNVQKASIADSLTANNMNLLSSSGTYNNFKVYAQNDRLYLQKTNSSGTTTTETITPTVSELIAQMLTGQPGFGDKIVESNIDVNNIDATMSHYYIKFSSGLIIQWGSSSVAQNGHMNVVMGTNFKSANTYRVITQDTSYYDAGHWQGLQKVVRQSGQSFIQYSAYDSIVTFDYIAIGF